MSRARLALVVSLLLVAAPLSAMSFALAAGTLTVSVSGGPFTIGASQELVVHVTGASGNPALTATITFRCLDAGCDPSGLRQTPVSITGDGTAGRGANGDYVFAVDPVAAGTYVADASAGSKSGSASFEVVARAAWILATVDVPEASLGETVTIAATLVNDAPTARDVAGTLYAGADPVASLAGSAPASGSVVLQAAYTPTAIGDIPLTLELADGARLDLGSLRVIAPARLAMDDVTASPILTRSVALTLHDANELVGASVLLRFDPDVVDVRQARFPADPNLGTLIEVDANGTIRVDVVAVKPASGDLILATIEFAAEELMDADSTLDLEVLEYARNGSRFALAEDATFHSRILPI